MITADQLVAHAIGDYVLQSDWMASKKRTENAAAGAHALVYSLPFLFFWPSTLAFVVIAVTHFLIDRYGLARYVVWAKNFLAPKWLPKTPSMMTCPEGLRSHCAICSQLVSNPSWRDCQATGYPPDRPPFLAVWLLIIADNILHVVINGLALRYL